ncbi:MAG: hypothetical protein EOP50_01760 [Sphingobacteriales bacterium]|nr:MAG: hypothetical protein EOP50_01760 [Sphingobacteriales bacterium]
MNTFLKILIPIGVALGLTALFQKQLEKGYDRYHVHKKERLSEIYEGKTAHDVLLLGSSRMHTTVWPQVLDSVAGTNSYNAGAEGGKLYEFRLTLDGYLASHPAPRLVVLSIDAQSFNSKNRLFFPIQYFFHLDNPAVAGVFHQQEDYKWAYLRYLTPLRIIYYDDYAKSLSLRGLAGSNELKRYSNFQNKGFLSNGYGCLDTLHATAMPPTKLSIDEEGKEGLRHIIETCRQKGIRLLLIYAPEYRDHLKASFPNFPEMLATVDSLRGDVPFLREDRLPLCQDPCYFANYGHVNTDGARAYSIILGNRIRELLGTQGR